MDTEFRRGYESESNLQPKKLNTSTLLSKKKKKKKPQPQRTTQTRTTQTTTKQDKTKKQQNYHLLFQMHNGEY